MKKLLVLSLMLLAGCSSGPTPESKPAPAAEKPAEEKPSAEKPPAEKPSNVPALQTLKGQSVAFEKVIVAGKRNLVVFMTAW